jgi:hypothetical protein
MHFSLVKSLYKNQVIWDYMTKKSPDFSQKVWLLVERNGGYKWLLVFFCLVSDHVKTSSHRWRVWGEEQGRARDRPGKRKCAEVCGFCGEAVGRELSLLMWLSCPLLLYFSCPTLARLSLTVFGLFHCFQSDLTLCQCLCATVGGQHAPVLEVSLLMIGRKESCPVSILFVVSCLTVSTFLPDRSKRQAWRCCSAVAAQRISSTGHFPPNGGGGQALVCLSRFCLCLRLTVSTFLPQIKPPELVCWSAVAAQRSRPTGHFPPKGGGAKLGLSFLSASLLMTWGQWKACLSCLVFAADCLYTYSTDSKHPPRCPCWAVVDDSTSTTGQLPPSYGGISYVYLFLPWNCKGGQSKVWLSCLIVSVVDCLPPVAQNPTLS